MFYSVIFNKIRQDLDKTYGKSHYPSRGEIKKVFGGIYGDALMSGKTGCSLFKINHNNDKRNRPQICSIEPLYHVLYDKIAV